MGLIGKLFGKKEKNKSKEKKEESEINNLDEQEKEQEKDEKNDSECIIKASDGLSKQASENADTANNTENKKQKGSWFARIASKFSGSNRLDKDQLAELEEILLSSDLGLTCTNEIIKEAKSLNADDVTSCIRKKIEVWLSSLENGDVFENKDKSQEKTQVILIVGVNGAGKTTTIGKLSNYLNHLDYKVMIAAADTFRAAAIEQLKMWGQKNNVPVIAQQHGSDSAAVVYDAMSSSHSKLMDFLIVDTSGRLHNKDHLLKELQRMTKVMKKQDEAAPHHVWLVVDSTNGQNALQQVKIFNEALGLTGLIYTKVDARKRVGTIVNIAREIPIPIFFLGKGEKVDDLEPFSVKKFIENW